MYFLSIATPKRCVIITALLVIQLVLAECSAQSLNGVRIGDSASTLQALNLQQISRVGEAGMKVTKFKLPNGNELSVTYDSRADRILYIVNDWNLTSQSNAVGSSNLVFGSTNLKDIRKMYGSNGFSWKTVFMQRSGNELIMFNAYEIRKKRNGVVVFVTSVDVEEYHSAGADSKLVPKLARLQAVIVADERYLDAIWGEEKIYDGVSRPISWKD